MDMRHFFLQLPYYFLNGSSYKIVTVARMEAMHEPSGINISFLHMSLQKLSVHIAMQEPTPKPDVASFPDV
jgi:hypothetical protein